VATGAIPDEDTGLYGSEENSAIGAIIHVDGI